MALSTDTLECNAARAPRSTDTRPVQGGAHAARLRARGGGAGGARRHPERPRRPRISIPRASGPSRTSGRPPITADHDGGHVDVTSRIEPARQARRSAVVAGNAAVRRGPRARLRRAAARAAAWAHRVVPAGERAGKGGRRRPPELSEPKCLIVAFKSLLPWPGTQSV